MYRSRRDTKKEIPDPTLCDRVLENHAICMQCGFGLLCTHYGETVWHCEIYDFVFDLGQGRCLLLVLFRFKRCSLEDYILFAIDHYAGETRHNLGPIDVQADSKNGKPVKVAPAHGHQPKRGDKRH